MKQHIRIATALCACFLIARVQVCAQAGMQFFEGTWSEALNEAQESGKLIFVDVYTDWCPPCKRMDKEVLPLPNVGQRYNDAFVNYKLDAEKGQGVALAEQYAVRAYPTYLYLDAEGNLLHRAVGFVEAPAFIAHADQATAAASGDQLLSQLQAAFNEGQRDREFLRTYIHKMHELGLDNSEALNAYFAELPWEALQHEEEWLFLGEHVNSPKSNALVFLMEHFQELEEGIQRKLAPKLFSLLYNATGQTVSAKDPATAKQLLAFAKPLLPYLGQRQQRGYHRYRLLYCGMVRDTAGIKQSGRELVSGLMDIPVDSIKAEDDRRYRDMMQPFWSGAQDSTQIEGFAEEKQMAVNTYSREITSYLYEAAKAYASTLPPEDPALQEALKWAVRCEELIANLEAFTDLIAQLRERAG